MGRLRSPKDAPAARAEIAAILDADLPPSSQAGRPAPKAILDPGSQGIRFSTTPLHDPLLILFAVTGLTLLMACANLAGLLLAKWGSDALVALAPGNVPRLAESGIAGWVLAFTLPVTVAVPEP